MELGYVPNDKVYIHRIFILQRVLSFEANNVLLYCYHTLIVGKQAKILLKYSVGNSLVLKLLSSTIKPLKFQNPRRFALRISKSKQIRH